MKTLTKVLLVLSLSIACFAQGGKEQTCPQKTTITTTASATPLTIPNDCGGVVSGFGYIITGSPATMSVVIQGVITGSPAVTLDTYTGTTSTTRTPSTSTPYDYFVVTATWTGGTNVSFTVRGIVTVAAGPPSTGTGNVSGPASATAHHAAGYADGTGKLLEDEGPMPAALAPVAHQYATGYAPSTGVISTAQPSSSDLSDLASLETRAEAQTDILAITSAATLGCSSVVGTLGYYCDTTKFSSAGDLTQETAAALTQAISLGAGWIDLDSRGHGNASGLAASVNAFASIYGTGYQSAVSGRWWLPAATISASAVQTMGNFSVLGVASHFTGGSASSQGTHWQLSGSMIKAFYGTTTATQAETGGSSSSYMGSVTTSANYTANVGPYYRFVRCSSSLQQTGTLCASATDTVEARGSVASVNSTTINVQVNVANAWPSALDSSASGFVTYPCAFDFGDNSGTSGSAGFSGFGTELAYLNIDAATNSVTGAMGFCAYTASNLARAHDLNILAYGNGCGDVSTNQAQNMLAPYNIWCTELASHKLSSSFGFVSRMNVSSVGEWRDISVALGGSAGSMFMPIDAPGTYGPKLHIVTGGTSGDGFALGTCPTLPIVAYESCGNVSGSDIHSVDVSPGTGTTLTNAVHIGAGFTDITVSNIFDFGSNRLTYLYSEDTNGCHVAYNDDANFTLGQMVLDSGGKLRGTVSDSNTSCHTYILPVGQGGTGANLSATGGASNVLKQTTAGGPITVSQENFTDLAGTATGGQLPATAVQTNQANTYSTGLQDFSLASLNLPAIASCTITTAKQICYDSTNNRIGVGNGTNTSYPLWTTAALVGSCMIKAVSTLGQATASSLCDNATTITTTEPIYGSNGVALAADTSIAATSFTTTGLVLPSVPLSTTAKGHCTLGWAQATAVSTVEFGIGVNAAPTDLWVLPPWIWNGTALSKGTATTITSTTVTAISAALVPAAITTEYSFEFDFTLKTPSSGAFTVTVYAESGSTSDAALIKAGSQCYWLP